MKKTILLLAILLFSNYCYCQYLIIVESNSDYKIKRYFIVTFLDKELSEYQINNFDIFKSNIFNYVFCCKYGTLSFPKIDSLEKVDSIKLSAWKEKVVNEHFGKHYDIAQSISPDNQQNFLKLKRRYKKDVLRISVGSFLNPTFCKCKDTKDETFTYTPLLNVSFQPLTNSEKSFFKKKVTSLIKNAPVANPILWN
ncbi:MAG: hypothetical protein ACK5YS_01875 [bacterium]|jgi:hypothetical protein